MIDLRHAPIIRDEVLFRFHRNGDYRSPTYHSWRMMKERCYRLNREHSAEYRKLGVRVWPLWLLPNRRGFLNFLADMGPRPEGKTLDRIDPEGNYEPSNCRWATPKEQANNRRR